MILAIIQARMSSTRLPGKVLLPIADKPVLQWVVEAVQATALVDRVVVAISTDPADRPIQEACQTMSHLYCAAEQEDVLSRFYMVACYENPVHVVRLTADCPALQPTLIDATIRHQLTGNYDYTRASVPGGWTDGHDVEVFTAAALTRAAKLAVDPQHREHVTPFFRESGLFRWSEFLNPQTDEKADKQKLSIDTQEDYHRVRAHLESSVAERKAAATIVH